MFSDSLLARAARLLEVCRGQGLLLATAESCTGGLVAALLTEVPGSSAVVDRGFVTYSNNAKVEMLGVSPAMIAAEGAVSEAVARAMADGVLRNTRADIAVSVTGIAGPGGGTASKPVGLVHFACARRDRDDVAVACRFGDLGRGGIRLASVMQALDMIERAITLP